MHTKIRKGQDPKAAGQKHKRTHSQHVADSRAKTAIAPPVSADFAADSPEARFQALNLELPPAPKPVGVYQSLLVAGQFAYASGHGPTRLDGSFITGRVGADLDLAAGKAAAHQTGLTILATVRRVLGTLDRVERVIKTFGLVNCTAEFRQHPHIINGCSELFAQIWGPDKGVGARSAVGANSLPSNIAVEIEVVFLLK